MCTRYMQLYWISLKLSIYIYIKQEIAKKFYSLQVWLSLQNRRVTNLLRMTQIPAGIVPPPSEENFVRLTELSPILWPHPRTMWPLISMPPITCRLSITGEGAWRSRRSQACTTWRRNTRWCLHQSEARRQLQVCQTAGMERHP